MKTSIGLAVAALVVVAGRPAMAQDVVVGWQGDDTAGYAFVAPTASFRLAPSHSMQLRTIASFLYYNSLAEGPTDVTAPGAAVALGYRFSGPRVNVALFGGFERRRVRHDWEQGPSVAGELLVSATPLTQVIALGNFAQANRYAWGRVGAKRQVTNANFSGPRAISLGVEATAQGNRDVTTYEMGAVIEHAWLRTGMSVQFRSGWSRSQFPLGPDQRKPYFGVGVYRRL